MSSGMVYFDNLGNRYVTKRTLWSFHTITKTACAQRHMTTVYHKLIRVVFEASLTPHLGYQMYSLTEKIFFTINGLTI